MCLFRPKRKTVEIQICSLSGLLPNEWCVEIVRRKFYAEPRPGEPIPPTETCTVHHAPDPDPLVEVTVCELSNMTPTVFCPCRKTIQVHRSELPLPYCNIHTFPVADISEPRTGIDFYQLIAFPLIDIIYYLDDLVFNGGSVLRVFMDFTWPVSLDNAGWKYSLFRQVGWWTDHGGEFDGQTFPLFTIAKSEEYGEPWNEAVWEKWEKIFCLCAARHIRLTVSLLDGCSMKTPIDNRHQPLLQNHQHYGAEGGDGRYQTMDGSTARGLGIHTGGIFGGFGGDDGTMKSYLPPLIKKIVETLNSSGVDYRINPGNEIARRPEGDETQPDVDRIIYEWHDYIIQLLRVEGVPNEKIVISITGENTREAVTIPLRGRYPGIIEQIHGPNSPKTMRSYLDRYPGAELDGDGFDPAATGYENDYGYRMPSIEQCRAIRAILIECGTKQYSIFNGYAEGRGWQDITRARWDEQRELAEK